METIEPASLNQYLVLHGRVDSQAAPVKQPTGLRLCILGSQHRNFWVSAQHNVQADFAQSQGMMQTDCFELRQIQVTSSWPARLTAGIFWPEEHVPQPHPQHMKKPFPLFTSHFLPSCFSSKFPVLIVCVGYMEREGAIPPLCTSPFTVSTSPSHSIRTMNCFTLRLPGTGKQTQPFC